MNLFRRFGLGVSILLFSVSVTLLAAFISLHFVIDTPDPLKSALKTSGIYTSSAPEALAQQASTSSSSLLSDPHIQQIFAQSLPSTYLQTSSETIIDSTYAWVQGTTPTLNFSIDTTEVKNNFANNLAAYVQQKLDSLPPCTLTSATPTSIREMVALSCRPHNVAPAAVAEMARQEALRSTLLSDNNTIDPSLLKNKQGEPLTNQLAFIPTLHRYYVMSLFVLPLLALLGAAAILLWSQTKRAGTKRIAWILVSTGLTTVVLAIVEVWLLHAGVAIFGIPATTSPSMQDHILAVIEILATDLRMWWIGFGVAYTLIGIILFIVLRLSRPKPTLLMGNHRSGTQPYTHSDIYESQPPAQQEIK